jgi:hypothetical protein
VADARRRARADALPRGCSLPACLPGEQARTSGQVESEREREQASARRPRADDARRARSVETHRRARASARKQPPATGRKRTPQGGKTPPLGLPPPQGGRGERFSRRGAKPFGTVGRLTEAEWVECLEWWTGQELNLGAPCCGRSLLRVSEAARAVGAADLRGLEGPTFPAYAPHAARMGSAGPQVLASGPSRAGRWRSTWCPSSGAVRLPAVPRGRVIAGWPWSGIRTHVSAREVSLPREERGEEPFSTTCQGSTRRDSTWSS